MIQHKKYLHKIYNINWGNPSQNFEKHENKYFNIFYSVKLILNFRSIYNSHKLITIQNIKYESEKKTGKSLCCIELSKSVESTYSH